MQVRERVSTLAYDSVLPGMAGRVAVPAGPGRNVMVPLREVTVSVVFGAFEYLAQAAAQWPFGAPADTFAGYIALEGPNWHLTAFFRDPAFRVEYHLSKADGGCALSGAAPWELLAQALVLSPDYDAVVDYLVLSPYRTAYYVA